MSPVLIGILSVVGVALTAATATFVTMGQKFKALADSKVKNDTLRAAMDLGLHLAGVSAQAAVTTVAADLASGNVAKVLPDVVAQVKAIATQQGSDVATQLLAMGESYLNLLVKSELAKLTPAKV